jgi:Zn-dependent peptidase ImmA (M78 family)/DNA-binding XRE family transcriptional regulator
MTNKAPINPLVLRWARETAHISIEEAAGKIGIKQDKLLEWETGFSQPTMRQAETLAKMFKRPFASFFLPEIPRDFQTLRDFRRDASRSLSTAAIFIIRDIQQKQAWISEMLQDEGADPFEFVGACSTKDAPEIVAQYMLKLLNINPGTYKKDVLQEWISRAEAAGFFITRTSFVHSRLKLDSQEFKGFAIADPFAPFVFINSKDWNAPQLFTLVHEIVHIIIAETGISGEIDQAPEKNNKFDDPIELFCNEVAAIALMPTDMMRSLDDHVFESGHSVFSAAKRFGVSSFAFLVRAYRLKLIPLSVYHELKRQADVSFKQNLQAEEQKKAAQKAKQEAGGPSPYFLRTLKNGRLFTQIVLSAFRGGRIQPTEASRMLDTPVNKFSKLEKYLVH